MRHLFDTKKEHKSIKLVKKLQKEADKEWENEIARRREQELNDEAIAKELQAQLEQESSAANGSNRANSPPPLPTKPRAYNSSTNISSSHATASSSSISPPTNYSSNSLPTASTTSPTSSTSPFATKPMYSISSTNHHSQPALPPRDQNAANGNKRPVKSYLSNNNSNERYKPELQFALASPAPCPSSVFYQKTPKMTPAITPLKALDTNTTNSASNNSALYNGSKTPTSSNGMQPSRPAPVTVQPQPPPISRPASTQPVINRMEMPMPTDMNPTHFQSMSANSAPSSYNNHHHQTSVTSPTQNAPYQPPSYAPHKSDPIVLPLSQPTPPQASSQQQQQHYSAPAAATLIPVAPPHPPLYPQQQQQQNDTNASYFPPPPPQQQQQQQQQQSQQQHYPYQTMRQSISSPAISLPLNSNGIYQQANYSQPQQQQQQQSPPAQQPSYSFNSVYQSTPPPQQQQQQSYASVKPPLVSAASSSGFQIPPMPVCASSSSSSNLTTKPQPQPQVQQKRKSTLAPTNPYYNKQDEPPLSNSTISLKPDEGQPKEYMHQDLLGLGRDNGKDDDEDEDDDWDIVRPAKTPHRPPTPMASNAAVNEQEEDEDDKESAIDYSDMIYHSGEKVQEEKEKKHTHSDHEEENEEEEEEEGEEDWEDTAIDPFDDDFAVHVPKGSKATSATVVGDFRKKRASSVVTTLSPTIQILDPTIIPATTSPIASPEEAEEKIIVQKRKPKQDKTEEDNTPRQYVEKESQEIEHRPITPHMNRQSMGSYVSSSVAATPAPSFYSPSPAPPHPSQQLSYYSHSQSTPLIELHLPEDEQSKVYPTNILKAGAPPDSSASQMQQQQQQAANPYFKKQGIVPATDYGYFKEGDQLANKTLPKLPPSATSNDDRHITVSSINPGQRVWIRIHPTDTGKDLAERIHIVASYQTRRVTKITTKQGRQISLDNKPLFEDWNEIVNFKEGEQWTVEWVPIEHPYVDIITEGKEFMKQLKANFRGSSSK
ncbi:something about silencing protein 10 [Mucor velutinosus]|uniref:Something about silencing protein 10 n=1 Tax=Mucor velutinosus TaxID=708070 RepID=A0AAN7HZ64_9FUNG|nr:something about silencing protein 10 [Mucor velutinosus]